MRIAAFSDVHGNVQALQAVLEAIDQLSPSVDRIICLGDLVGRGPNPNEVIALLRERGVESVRGNYDDAVAFDRIGSGNDFPDVWSENADRQALEWTRRELTPENLEYLRAIPHDVRLERGAGGVRIKRNQEDERTSEYRKTFFARALFGGLARTPARVGRRIVAMHGSPRGLNEIVRDDTARSILTTIAQAAQADVIITGHAALGYQREEGEATFIGVGAVSGLRSNPGEAQFVVIEIGDDVSTTVESVPYEDEGYRRAMEDAGLTPAAI